MQALVPPVPGAELVAESAVSRPLGHSDVAGLDCGSDGMSSYAPPVSSQGTCSSDDTVLRSAALSKKFDEECHEESLLRWLEEEPGVCQQVLESVEYDNVGWCKVAKKAGNVSCQRVATLVPKTTSH